MYPTHFIRTVVPRFLGSLSPLSFSEGELGRRRVSVFQRYAIVDARSLRGLGTRDGCYVSGPRETNHSCDRGFVAMKDGVLTGNKAICDLTLCRVSGIFGVLGGRGKKRRSEPFAISICSLPYAFFDHRRNH